MNPREAAREKLREYREKHTRYICFGCERTLPTLEAFAQHRCDGIDKHFAEERRRFVVEFDIRLTDADVVWLHAMHII